MLASARNTVATLHRQTQVLTIGGGSLAMMTEPSSKLR